MRREQVFWGWGEPGAGPSLGEHAAALLRSELGISGERVSTPVALEDVALPVSALSPAFRERLASLAELVQGLGGIVVGCAFVVELAFLDGRRRLEGFDVLSLVCYDHE